MSGLSRDKRRGSTSRTYFRSGRRVSDQTIALRPPITSSLEGTSPLDGQIPLST